MYRRPICFGVPGAERFACDPCPEASACRKAKEAPVLFSKPQVSVSPSEADKPTNPKDAIGTDKLPLHLWPTTATIAGSIAMLNGALKYGRANWRASGVRASIYYDAARRHLDAWFEGEECDPDDGVPHLSAALACLAIIVDARAAGKLVDDRMVAGGHRAFAAEMSAHVKRLKALHAGRAPRHYTIADAPDAEQSRSTTAAGRQPGAPDAAPEQAAAEQSTLREKPAAVILPEGWAER